MIQPKYDVGQKVWVGRGWYGTKPVPCPDCKGTRTWRVSTPAGESFDVPCGTCFTAWEPSGTVSEYGPKVEVRLVTVGSIRIATDDKERPVEYMMEETGVGSGTLHPERSVFQTEEEALAYAKEEARLQTGRAVVSNAESLVRKKKDRVRDWRAGKIKQLRKEIETLERAIRFKAEREADGE